MTASHDIEIEGRKVSWRAGESLLDALERQAVDIPSSCRSGACHSCLIKAEQGGAPKAAQVGLKDAWKQQALFLACMAKDPCTLKLALPNASLSTEATLVESSRLAPDVVRLRFALVTPFAYRAGQFLSLTRADGLTRSYSIASVPTDAHVELHVRRTAGGRMSCWLYDEATVGARVTMRGPQGDCFYLEGRPKQTLVLVATGTGLAPMIGIARDALAQGHRGEIHLIHGGRTREDLYLHDTLVALAAGAPNVRYLPALSGSHALTDVYSGRVTSLLSERYADLTDVRVFACGSPAMVKEVKQHAYRAGAALDDLLADAFVPAPAPASASAVVKPTAPRKRKRSLPLLSAAPLESAGANAKTVTPRSQKLRFAVQALTLAGFLTQALLYYNTPFRPLGGLLPFMAYDSLGHMVASSALLMWSFLFLLVLVFGRFVCGWLCPLGFMQDAGEKLLRRFHITLRRPLSQPRLLRMITTAIILGNFIVLPLLAAPVRIWQFDLHYKEPWLLGFPFRSGLFVLDLLLVFVVIGIVLPLFFGPRPYCKMVCETGYLLDLTSRGSFGRIRRNTGFDRDTCLSCQRCSNICPQGIKVDEEVQLFDRVVSTTCITCLQCVGVCPNNTIVYSLKKRVLDTGRAAGYLATLNTQLTDLPRFAWTIGGTTLGAWIGFVELPPSYFHTYVLLASLGGMLGFLGWRLSAHLFGKRLENQLEVGARTQVEIEKEERILPLSVEERNAARGTRSTRIPRLLLAGGLALSALGTASAIYIEVPPRILSLEQLQLPDPVARARAGVFHLGVPAVHSADITHQAYRGLPKYLGERLGLDVRLVSADTYTEVGWAIVDGRIDAALVPAGAASTLLRKAPKAVECVGQVVHNGMREDDGVIVGAQGGAKSLEDLVGKRVAFVRIDSLSGYWAPSSLLSQHGVPLSALSRVILAGDHSEALRLLDAGQVDAAVSFKRSYVDYRSKHAGFTPRVLATIPHLPNDVLLVATRLPVARRAAFVSALEGVFKDADARDVRARLADAAGITGLVAADASALSAAERWMR